MVENTSIDVIPYKGLHQKYNWKDHLFIGNVKKARKKFIISLASLIRVYSAYITMFILEF